jgi:mono/diheme cytochrome c family protein
MGALPLAFIGIWVLLALGLVVVALFGGVGQARERMLHSQTRRARRVIGLLVAAVFILMGVVVPGLVVASNEKREQAGAARTKLNADMKRGRQLFGEQCNQCHTLAASDTKALVGPNLDKLRPNRALVLDAIEKGRARGQGRMPAQLVQGEDAEAVAAYVAAVAGKQ